MLDFLFELGQLKRVRRSGWWLLGIKDPESVADHSFRCAAIAYFLAKEEGADPYKCVLAGLFNDMHETRVNDLHKLGQAYVDFKSGEKKAYEAQLSELGDKADDLKQALSELHNLDTKEGNVARDADLIECALQAREYEMQGYTKARDWLGNVRKIVQTDTGKKWIEQIEKADPSVWWQGKKRIER